MGAAYVCVGKRGSVCLDIGFSLCGSCAVRPVVWVRDVGCFTAHWEDLSRIKPQVGLQTDRASNAEGTGWYVGVTPAREGEGRGMPT